MIWETVRQVGGFFSLAAFIVAAVLLYTRTRLVHESKRLEALPPNHRERALDALLSRFAVDVSRLSRAQQYELALTQLHTARRATNHRFILSLVATVLLAGLWGVSMMGGGGDQPRKPVLNEAQRDSLLRHQTAAGWARRNSRPRQALSHYEQAARLDPTNAEVQKAITDIQRQLDEVTK